MTTFPLRKLCWIFILLWLVPALQAGAQGKAYSLSSLADSARRYLPSLLEKQALLQVARTEVTDTRHSFLPRIKFIEQLTLGTDNSLAGSYFSYGITPSTSAGIRAGNDLQAASGNIGVLYGEYELVNFGLNRAKLKSAQSYVDLQQAELDREEYLLDLSVAKLYFTILKNQYRLLADQQSTERYRNIYTVIKALTSSGINAGADSSLASAELSKSIITYNQTLGTVNQLKEQLSYLTGIPARRLQIDTVGHDFMNIRPVFSYTGADTVNNPLVNYYKRFREIFSATDKVIRKSYLPKILLSSSVWLRGSSIQYNDQYKSLYTGLGYQRFNYGGGIALTYDIFSRISRNDKLAANRFRQEAATARLQQQQLAILSASNQAEQALLTAEGNLRELPVELKSAEATFRQKLAQYKAGIISLIDLTNASFVLYRSQTDLIEILSDWYLAQLDKAQAAGTLKQFINAIN